MKKMTQTVFNRLSLSPRDNIFVGFSKTLLKILALLTIVPLVYFTTMIIELKHFCAYKKDHSNHKIKGFTSTQSGNMIKMSYDNKCSCGMKGSSKTITEILTKMIDNAFPD